MSTAPLAIDPRPREIAEAVKRAISPSTPEGDRLAATLRLSELAMSIRRSTLPRGTPEAAAEAMLTDADERALIESLDATDGELRYQLVVALGELGGQAAAEVISDLLDRSDDEEAQQCCISALETLGGPAAIAALRRATAHEAVRDSALWGLKELYTGGTWDLSEGLVVRPPVPKALEIDAATTCGKAATVENGDVPKPVEIDAAAISQEVNKLRDASDRRKRLKAIVQRAVRPKPGVSWDQQLIQLADEGRWDEWAVESLPTSLIVQVNGGSVWLLWSYIARLLKVIRGDGITVRRTLCKGVVAEVAISPSAGGPSSSPEEVLALVQEMDQARKANHWSGERSMRGVVTDGLDSLTQKLQERSAPQDQIDRVVGYHVQVARESNLPVSEPAAASAS